MGREKTAGHLIVNRLEGGKKLWEFLASKEESIPDKIRCKPCGFVLDCNFRTKTMGTQHTKSAKHKKNVSLYQKAIDDPLNSGSKQNEFFAEMTKAFTAANIPLHKLNNNDFRAFLEKYTKRAAPSESTLRKNYLPKKDPSEKEATPKKLKPTFSEDFQAERERSENLKARVTHLEKELVATRQNLAQREQTTANTSSTLAEEMRRHQTLIETLNQIRLEKRELQDQLERTQDALLREQHAHNLLKQQMWPINLVRPASTGGCHVPVTTLQTHNGHTTTLIPHQAVPVPIATTVPTTVTNGVMTQHTQQMTELTPVSPNRRYDCTSPQLSQQRQTHITIPYDLPF